MAIAATGDAVAIRMVSSASKHVEFAKAFMMELKKSQTLTAEAFHMVDQDCNKCNFMCKCKRGRGHSFHYSVVVVKNNCLQSTQNQEKPLV